MNKILSMLIASLPFILVFITFVYLSGFTYALLIFALTAVLVAFIGICVHYSTILWYRD